MFDDDQLEKEENGKLQENLFKWLLYEDNIDIEPSGLPEGELSDGHKAPDIGNMSEQLRCCLQESEHVPLDFTKMFDTSLFKFDTDTVPEAIKL